MSTSFPFFLYEKEIRYIEFYQILDNSWKFPQWPLLVKKINRGNIKIYQLKVFWIWNWLKKISESLIKDSKSVIRRIPSTWHMNRKYSRIIWCRSIEFMFWVKVMKQPVRKEILNVHSSITELQNVLPCPHMTDLVSHLKIAIKLYYSLYYSFIETTMNSIVFFCCF